MWLLLRGKAFRELHPGEQADVNSLVGMSGEEVSGAPRSRAAQIPLKVDKEAGVEQHESIQRSQAVLRLALRLLR